MSLTLLLMLALLARAIDVEYVDQFPHAEDFIETGHEGGFCDDGRVFGIVYHKHETETNIGYTEYYLHPETEEPKVVVFLEIDYDTGEVLNDIYVRNQGKIEHYTEIFAFQEAYPNGVCNPRVDEDNL